MSEENYRKVLIIYTGGTIGMEKSEKGYVPAAGYLSGFLKSRSQFHDSKAQNRSGLPYICPVSAFGTSVAYDIIEYTPLLDSCNMGMGDWSKIAQDIASHYHNFDAFIVLHGTDTMAFTASALSFMFNNLGKTVIITGSQIPLSEIRNDGIDNLLGALLIAGNFDIPEVCLYFNNKLFRGNRSVKFDSANLNAFTSHNFPPIVEVGIDFKVKWPLVLPPPGSEAFSIQKEMNPNVGAMRLFPGITPQAILNFCQPPLKGLILQTYGAGNAPDSDKDFLDTIKWITDRGIIIVNCTQCARGVVEGHYATGIALREAGVIPGADMTVEAALTKLSYLLARGDSVEEIKALMEVSLRGELTERDAPNP